MKSLFKVFLIVIFFFVSCKKDPLFDPSQSNIPDQENFDVLEKQVQHGVSLLFFYNVWDKNSLNMLPKIEAIARKQAFDSVYFAKVDFDKNPSLARFFVIRGFPVVVLLKDGTERTRYEGDNHSQEKIEKRLLELL
ncbi:MAG: thioredoxin family protein [Bacteroidia bacterium]|nr:thioredoxin family protein [Bacteroidia bacterium]